MKEDFLDEKVIRRRRGKWKADITIFYDIAQTLKYKGKKLKAINEKIQSYGPESKEAGLQVQWPMFGLETMGERRDSCKVNAF